MDELPGPVVSPVPTRPAGLHENNVVGIDRPDFLIDPVVNVHQAPAVRGTDRFVEDVVAGDRGIAGVVQRDALPEVLGAPDIPIVRIPRVAGGMQRRIVGPERRILLLAAGRMAVRAALSAVGAVEVDDRVDALGPGGVDDGVQPREAVARVARVVLEAGVPKRHADAVHPAAGDPVVVRGGHPLVPPDPEQLVAPGLAEAGGEEFLDAPLVSRGSRVCHRGHPGFVHEERAEIHAPQGGDLAVALVASDVAAVGLEEAVLRLRHG